MIFALWMAVAAVVLDHHWLIDVVLGWLTCLVSYAAVRSAVRAVRTPGAVTTMHPEARGT